MLEVRAAVAQLVQLDLRGQRERGRPRRVEAPRTTRPSWPSRSHGGADGACPARSPAGGRRGVRTTTGRPSAVRSASGPAATSRPRATMTTSSTVCSTSESTWLDTSTVRPWVARWRRKPRSQAMPSGSSPFAGSSSTRTSGSPSSAVASCRRWRMPREYPPARRSPASVRPTCASTSSTRSDGSPAAQQRTRRWSRPVRPGWNPVASSAAPTVVAGWASSAYGVPVERRGAGVGRTSPRSSAASWSCRRRWARGSR